MLLSLSKPQARRDFYNSLSDSLCKQRRHPATLLAPQGLTQQKARGTSSKCKNEGGGAEKEPKVTKQELAQISAEPHAPRRAFCLRGRAAACSGCQEELRSSPAGLSQPQRQMCFAASEKELTFPTTSLSLVPQRWLHRNKKLGLQLVTGWPLANNIILLEKTKILVSVNRTALRKACTAIPEHQHHEDRC